MSWSTKSVSISNMMIVEGDLVVDSEVVFTSVVPPPEPHASTTSVDTVNTGTPGTTSNTST